MKSMAQAILKFQTIARLAAFVPYGLDSMFFAVPKTPRGMFDTGHVPHLVRSVLQTIPKVQYFSGLSIPEIASANSGKGRCRVAFKVEAITICQSFIYFGKRKIWANAVVDAFRFID